MKEAGKMKLGLTACMVVIVCLLVFSGWNYARINDMQKRATELEAQVADLESQVGSLETDLGALNFTFMATEQLEVQGCTFDGTSGSSNNSILVSVKNTGTADLTVDKYKLGTAGTQVDITDVSVTQGNTATVNCTTANWSFGTTYDIYLITSTGKQFPYRATAP